MDLLTFRSLFQQLSDRGFSVAKCTSADVIDFLLNHVCDFYKLDLSHIADDYQAKINKAILSEYF